MDRSENLRKILKWSIVLGVLLALVLVYKFFNPLENPYFPKCPVLVLTGLECPGCGSQRAIHHLLNLNIIEAFKNNALLVISIPYLITGFIFDVRKKLSPGMLKWRKILFGEKAIYIILVIIVLYTILRNIF